MSSITNSKKQFDLNDKDEMIMTEKNILLLCEKEEGCYEYAELNSKLYLNYKSFSKIQQLDAFVNVKTLYLDHNLIEKIEGLEKLTQLNTLQLQGNLIKKIEGLENNTELLYLNLSKNGISKIENVGHLKQLRNFDISENCIKTPEEAQELQQLDSLTTLNLQRNNFEFSQELVDIIQSLQNLLVLYFGSNPCIREIKNYRKVMITKMQNLRFLDDKAVDDDERIMAEKFLEGGIQAVKEERNRQKELKELQKQEEIKEFQKTAFKKKSQRLQMMKNYLKQSYLKEADISVKINNTIKKGHTHYGEVALLRQKLESEQKYQHEVRETIENLQKQVDQLQQSENFQKESTEFEKSIQESLKQDIMKDEEIDQILDGVIQMHDGDFEQIWSNFSDTINFINRQLYRKIDIEQMKEKIKEKIQNYNSSNDPNNNYNQTSSYSDQNSQSLSQYDTSQTNSNQQSDQSQSQSQSQSESGDISDDNNQNQNQNQSSDLDELD